MQTMSTPLDRFPGLVSLGVALGLLVAADARAQPSYTFASPVFGLATAPDGSLLVADAGAGIVELREDGAGTLIATLPGVTDIAPLAQRDMLAITGGGRGPGAAKLYRVVKGKVLMVADLGRFEATVNPDGLEVNPNPFDVAAIARGKTLVSDAGGNSLLLVTKDGAIDWVATLPQALASTANIKGLFDCPAGPPDICNDLPAQIPAQAVATSIAIGPDGAYYMGELKGFPAPTGESRIWRIEPGANHATCGSSPACRVVADGFTSIVDLAFGSDGTLYVVELDEASWFAVEVEAVRHKALGGTVNACNLGAGTCTTLASDLPMPIAVTVGNDGEVFALIGALIPGGASVISLRP
jgi:hypothetical protein